MSSALLVARSPSVLTVLVVTMALQTVAAMCLVAVPTISPSMAHTLGVSPVYIGAFVALTYAGGMFTSLAAGSLVRRFGALRTCQIGLGLCSTGILLCAVPSVPSALAGATLMGLGYGPITPSGSHLLARNSPPRRMSIIFSIKQTGVPLGGALAGAIVPGLASFFSWSTALALLGVFGWLFVLGVQPWRAGFDSDRDISHRISFGSGVSEPIRLVWHHRILTLLAVLSLLFAVIQLSLTSYLATYLGVDLGMSLVLAGFVVAIAQGAGVVGRLLWGYLADRLNAPVAILALLAFTVTICTALTPQLRATDLIWVAVLFAVFGGCALGWNGVYLAEVARRAPDGQVSAATGGTNALTFLGDVLGPPLFGLVAAATQSYGTAFAFLAVPAVGCLWLLAAYRTQAKARLR